MESGAFPGGKPLGRCHLGTSSRTSGARVSAFLCSQQMCEIHWLAQNLLQGWVRFLWQRQRSSFWNNNNNKVLQCFYICSSILFLRICLQNPVFKSWEARQFPLLVSCHLSISGLCLSAVFLYPHVYYVFYHSTPLSLGVCTRISEWAAIHVFCYSYWPICDPHVVFTFNHYPEFKTINFSIGFLSIVAIISIWMPHKP